MRRVAKLYRLISIHALRVEGDLFIWRIKSINQLFLSTPSGWRATTGRFVLRFVGIKISIHALRVEGDTSHTADNGTSHGISIHALRVEGDSKNRQSFHLFLRKREKNLPL